MSLQHVVVVRSLFLLYAAVKNMSRVLKEQTAVKCKQRQLCENVSKGDYK